MTVPVLSIFGTADKYLSIEAARGTQRYVENLTEDYVDGVGHWVQMEEAQEHWANNPHHFHRQCQ